MAEITASETAGRASADVGKPMVVDSLSLIREFISLYQALDKQKLNLLDELYHHDVVFTDPLHTIQGLAQLKQYFSGMYENLLHIHFDIHRQLLDGDQVCLEWTMRYAHKKLKKGDVMTVHGMSWLKLDGQGKGLKIIHHRDYFDAGQMLYEQIPILGSAIRLLKKRMAV